MELTEIIKTVDHTQLSQTAAWEDIRLLCDDGVKYGAASVCIPPAYVAQTVEYVAGKIPVCTVIGFPNGYNTTAVKCFEASDAVKNGAAEIDMVINLGWVKDKLWAELENEISAVKTACGGKLLKVIIETCFLSNDEKTKMCQIISKTGADFVKTSTGFGGGGATLEDVALMRRHSGQHVKVKASGGITGLEDAEAFIKAGADRLGTSRVIKAVKAEKPSGNTY